MGQRRKHKQKKPKVAIPRRVFTEGAAAKRDHYIIDAYESSLTMNHPSTSALSRRDTPETQHHEPDRTFRP